MHQGSRIQKKTIQKKTLVISESSNKEGVFLDGHRHSNKIAVRNKEGRILRGRAAKNFGFGDSPTSFFHKENRVSRLPNHENFAPAARLSPDCQDEGRIQSLDCLRAS